MRRFAHSEGDAALYNTKFQFFSHDPSAFCSKLVARRTFPFLSLDRRRRRRRRRSLLLLREREQPLDYWAAPWFSASLQAADIVFVYVFGRGQGLLVIFYT